MLIESCKHHGVNWKNKRIRNFSEPYFILLSLAKYMKNRLEISQRNKQGNNQSSTHKPKRYSLTLFVTHKNKHKRKQTHRKAQHFTVTYVIL